MKPLFLVPIGFPTCYKEPNSFWLFKIGLSADIEAIFMQIEVPEHEQCVHRYLWREEPSFEIENIQYTRHIFGAT